MLATPPHRGERSVATLRRPGMCVLEIAGNKRPPERTGIDSSAAVRCLCTAHQNLAAGYPGGPRDVWECREQPELPPRLRMSNHCVRAPRRRLGTANRGGASLRSNEPDRN